MTRLLLALGAAALFSSHLPALANDDDDGHHGRDRVKFELVETTIPEIHEAMRSNVLSAERLTQMYLKRIDAYEEPVPHINAFIHINENALRVARQLDALNDHHHGRPSRKPLFGVPVLLKDNIDTADMPTTAGSVALAARFRRMTLSLQGSCARPGAIILGKGTLTEFANFLAVGMPTGYSSLGNFGFNPYDPRVDPATDPPNNDGRPVLQTGGSSSGPGIGVNANLAAIAVGTETSGIDLESGERERRRGYQADAWARQPRRHHSDHCGSGHGWADHAHGDGCCHSARRAWRGSIRTTPRRSRACVQGTASMTTRSS
jgi:amidase